MPLDTTQIRVDTGPITQITLFGSKGLNLLSVQTVRDLLKIFKDLQKQPEIRAVILTGQGEKAFCAGANMQELINLEDIPTYVELGQELMYTIEHLPAPVIGGINGYALGAGFSLALACDLRILSEHAQIGQLAVRNGLIPPFGNIQRILQIAGPARGRKLILTGRILDAQKSLDYHLCHQVTKASALMQACFDLAHEIAQSPAHAVRWSKTVINRTLEESYSVGYALQEDALIECLEHPDSHAIMAKFLNKSQQ